MHIWGYWYFFLAILIPACASSSPAFLMIYSAYKLNKQGDNIQPDVLLSWFGTSLCSMSSSNCCFLSCLQASQKVGNVVWYSHFIKNIPPFVVIHIVKGFSRVNEAEVDVFLEFLCFSYGSAYVGNLISGSSAFSKSSLNIWKFMVHVLLKPSLEDFEHFFAIMGSECNCEVVWTFFGIVIPGTGMKTYLFLSCGHCWVF